MEYDKNSYPKKDIYQEITNKIITEMEKGELPWQKGWNNKAGVALLSLPQNAITGEPYHKANAITLTLAAKQFGDGSDPRFCSFNAAKEKGWMVKKGSHGFPVLHGFWVDKDKFGVKLPIEKQHWERRFSIVFHASQLQMVNERGEYIPISAYDPKAKIYVHEETLKLAEKLLKKSKAVILNDQLDKAFYSHRTDDIHLPAKETFPKLEDYYATALHELGHWTGHETRLNRNINNEFGTIEYAKEELRAEMASVYLSFETGLPLNPTNHAAYTQGWLEALKKDKTEFFKAAADAERIANYVIHLVKAKDKTNDERVKNVEDDQLQKNKILQKKPLNKDKEIVVTVNQLMELNEVKNAKDLVELQAGADEKEIYFAYLKQVLEKDFTLTNEEADKKIIAALGREHMNYENIKNVISYSPILQEIDNDIKTFIISKQVFSIVNPVITQNEAVQNAKAIIDLRSWSNPDEIYFSHLKKVLYDNPLLRPEEANREVVLNLINAKMKPSKIKQCLMHSLHVINKNILERQQYAKDLVENICKENNCSLAR